MTTREDQLHELTDLLGDDHDLAVLHGVLRTGPDGVDDEASRTVAAFADRRRAHLQQEAVTLGRRLFALDRDAVEDQLLTWWAAWRDQAEADALPAALALEPA